ncbi:MAG TPA: FAD-dependent monooxygenase [Vicinamibacterales bacterium]|jgi:2-polyprenyl-6-methoxyphenol hydroxylase-like FAD-dependent oxidoreductase
MSNDRRILIVGGGIAGLTLAAALAKRGLSHEIVERSATWPTVGAGIAVQPNGVRIFEHLGLSDALIDAGIRIGRWRFCDQHGQVLCETDLDDVWAGVGPFIGVARRALHQVLLHSITSVPRRLGVSVTAVACARHTVIVQFSDGSEGTYDLVIGCDGLHSTVRSFVDDVPLVDGGQMVWRSLSPIRPLGVNAVQFVLGDDSFFGLCPVGDGGTYGFANVTQTRVRDPEEGRLSRLRQRFASYGDVVQEYLASLTTDEQIHCSPIEWLARPCWGNGRVLLIGDAAHASSPMLGQGGCLAMEDAHVLAEILETARDWSLVLGAFAGRRTPRVNWVRDQSLAAGDAFGRPSHLRNAVLRERGDGILRSRYEPLLEEP